MLKYSAAFFANVSHTTVHTEVFLGWLWLWCRSFLLKSSFLFLLRNYSWLIGSGLWWRGSRFLGAWCLTVLRFWGGWCGWLIMFLEDGFNLGPKGLSLCFVLSEVVLIYVVEELRCFQEDCFNIGGKIRSSRFWLEIAQRLSSLSDPQNEVVTKVARFESHRGRPVNEVGNLVA